MRPVTIGNATLYLADCLAIQGQLGNVDHVVTDPPYEEQAHTKARRQLSKGSENGSRKIDVLPINFDAITEEQRRMTARFITQVCQGWALTFCQVEAAMLWRDALVAGGAKYMRTCVWIKPDGAPQFTGDRPGMGYESIVAAWCGEGRSKWNGGGKHGVYTFSKSDPGYGHGGLQNEHPTKKPQTLMAALISDFTRPGDIVFDPYMGSGSTGVACMTLGRRFIGIEKNREYFDAACERIGEAQKQGRLFG